MEKWCFYLLTITFGLKTKRTPIHISLLLLCDSAYDPINGLFLRYSSIQHAAHTTHASAAQWQSTPIATVNDYQFLPSDSHQIGCRSTYISYVHSYKVIQRPILHYVLLVLCVHCSTDSSAHTRGYVAAEAMPQLLPLLRDIQMYPFIPQLVPQLRRK